ncbi:hypothetical protein [Variovorax sp. KBW07]|uniref:hypothetical protein n=1 Tax=Variovorax sp. KBW07 TaxID=2153358 RepID=UPI000F55DE46|nr:hypothetical protein [Variovorax sp. KBW07]
MKKTRLLFAAMVAAVLTACGGGGGGGGFSGPPLGWVPSPGPGAGITEPPAEPPKQPPAAITASYKYLTFQQDRDPDHDTPEKRFDDYIALLNREGAAGYRYIEGSAGGNIVTLQDKFLMVKDTETTYSYEYKTIEINVLHADVMPRLLQQMKDQGAQGKVFIQFLGHLTITPPPDINPVFAVLYRKDEGASTTYDVEAADYQAAAADVVATANALGANGFRPWSVQTTGGPSTRERKQFFIKDNNSAARYEVKAVISPLSVVGGDFPDVKKQIQDQGALGYRLLKNRFMNDANGDGKDFFLYVKDTTQASTYEFEFLDNPDALFGLQEANATQANAQTANGLRYFGEPDAPVFFRSLNCTGVLCVSPTKAERTEEL